MPNAGKHNVNTIDSFFKNRPSHANIREGETVSFLEKGNLVKLEKRNGIVYETSFVEHGKKLTSSDSQTIINTSGTSDIDAVIAGTGLDGGGLSGSLTINIDSTVATLTGSQTLTNKTLTAPTLTTPALGTPASGVLTNVTGTAANLTTGKVTVTDSTANTNFPVIFHDESNALLDDTSALTYNPSSGTLVVPNLNVSGTTTTVDTTNLVVSDKLIELSNGATGTPEAEADSGLIIERGSSDNVFIGWDEGSDRVRFAITSSVGSDDTVSFSSNANIQAGRLYGDVTGDVTGSLSGGTVSSLTSPIALAEGGTGASDANTARTNLGLEIGLDVQAYNSTLASVAGGTYTGDDSITTLGTIGTGVWQGTAIASAYLDADTAHLSGTQTFSGAKTFSSNITVGGTVDGRDVAADGTKLDGIEALADVTDTANVTSAGALMDSEVDADIKTLSLPANTTISATAKTLLDDGSIINMRTTLGLDIGSDVQAFDLGLTNIAGLTTVADKMIYTTASDVYATTTLSAVARTLLDDSTTANMLTTLGLTATAAELNYTDGVTSNIQTQLGTKVPTTRSITPVSQRGISGGGDLSADRTFELSKSQLSQVTLDAADTLILFDADDDVPKRFVAQDIFDSLGGITIDGTTANGVLTYGGTNNIDAEANLTFDGSTLNVDGTIVVNEGNAFTDIVVQSDRTSGNIGGITWKNNVGTIRNQIYGNYDGELLFTSAGSGEKMRIDSSGNVGIGIASPAANLDVAGSGGTDGAAGSPTLRLSNTVDSTDWDTGDVVGTLEYYAQDPSGNAPYVTSFIKSVNGVDGSNGTLPSGALTFGVSAYNAVGGAVEKMRIDSTGNVGIGTDSPDYELDVAGDIGVDHLITHNSDSNTYVQFTNDRLRFAAGGEVLLDLFEDGTQDYVKLGDGGDVDINLNDDMFVEGSSGNVGIGTTSPQTTLHLSNTTTAPILRLGNEDNSIAAGADLGVIQFYSGDDSGGGNAIKSTISSIQPATSPVSGELVFKTTLSTGSLTEAMRIDASQNVGIGTTSPSAKLDVVGNIKSSGHLELPYGEINDAGTDMNIVSTHALTLRTGSGTALTIPNASTNVGIGTTSPGYKLDVTGDARILSGSLGVGVAPNATDGRGDFSNDVVAYSTSDKRLKENIKPLDNALDKVLQINGVSFDWKELTEEEKKTIHGNEGHDVGVIAQEIEAILPEVVTTRDTGYKAVKYEKIVPLLIEAIKEQQQQIDELIKGNFVIETGN